MYLKMKRCANNVMEQGIYNGFSLNWTPSKKHFHMKWLMIVRSVYYSNSNNVSVEYRLEKVKVKQFTSFSRYKPRDDSFHSDCIKPLGNKIIYVSKIDLWLVLWIMISFMEFTERLCKYINNIIILFSIRIFLYVLFFMHIRKVRNIRFLSIEMKTNMIRFMQTVGKLNNP